MLIKDADLLRRLLESKSITARQLSRDMGWHSHSYMNRILAGSVRSVTPDAAVKIAYLLQVPVDLIFAPRLSGDTRHSGKGKAA
jgi:transcriptional regulator with XRE-family HTH domain